MAHVQNWPRLAYREAASSLPWLRKKERLWQLERPVSGTLCPAPTHVQAWWCMPVIQALKRLNQDDLCTFEASLGCIAKHRHQQTRNRSRLQRCENDLDFLTSFWEKDPGFSGEILALSLFDCCHEPCLYNPLMMAPDDKGGNRLGPHGEFVLGHSASKKWGRSADQSCLLSSSP